MVKKFPIKMGRETGDHIVIQSSISLLQERFRQLQRMKQMREQRELLRMLSESERCGPTEDYEPSSLFFQSELVLRPRPPLQVSLSLWPNSQSKHSAVEIAHLTKSWPTAPADTSLVCTSSIKTDDSDFDVDTSLHL